MIKNKPNFVPAKYQLQPDFYVEYFNCVTAVFAHPNGRNILVEVDAKLRPGRSPRDAQGNLFVEYQGSESRHIIYPLGFGTLREAMEYVQRLMDNASYGEKYSDKPIPVSAITRPRYSNQVLIERERKERKARLIFHKPSSPFTLSDEDKKILEDFGYHEEDWAQIERCANESVYLLNDEKSIPLSETVSLLGKEAFLSGIARSAFHFSAVRETLDGEHEIFFESGPDTPFRKKERIWR